MPIFWKLGMIRLTLALVKKTIKPFLYLTKPISMYKKAISGLAALLVTISAFSQESFVINHDDMPPLKGDVTVRVYQNSRGLRSTAKGNFGNKDFSLLGEGEQVSMNYYTEDDPLFTGANLTVARKTEKKFVPGFVYYYASVLAFPGDGIYEAGIKVPAQTYPLTKFTGKATDHLDIPEQQYILDEPKKLIEFPMEEGSSWSSQSRRTTHFTLTIAAYGLKNVPAQHVWTVYREEKIVGHGKIRVYHEDGPSDYYEVLKSEITEYAIDSFYLGGKPAPAALLKAFGATQGQKISIDNKVNFYRKGHCNYLFSLYFGANPLDGAAVSIFADMDVERPQKEGDEKKEEGSGIQAPEANLPRTRK
jgi:hypothetical protein